MIKLKVEIYTQYEGGEIELEEEYEDEETTSFKSSGWGWLWFIIGFIIFLLLVAPGS